MLDLIACDSVMPIPASGGNVKTALGTNSQSPLVISAKCGGSKRERSCRGISDRVDTRDAACHELLQSVVHLG
jgi:hypothetical protein